MAIKRRVDEEFVALVESRVETGHTNKAIASELGMSRQTLESRLLKAGWRVGRKLLPVKPIQEARS